MTATTHREVRGIPMTLMAYNRSLELCARMNYETEVLDLIDSMEAGQVFYDLGACEGRFSIYAALKGMTCFAFEPESANFCALQENIAANPPCPDRIHAFQCAIGDDFSKARLQIGQPWPGGHQKVLARGSGRGDLNFSFVASQDVEVAPLDGIIAREQLPLPDCLKVDIDGSELLFLAGAKETLRNQSLRRIMIELSRADAGCCAIHEQLLSHGFHLLSEHQVPNEPNLFNGLYVRK